MESSFAGIDYKNGEVRLTVDNSHHVPLVLHHLVIENIEAWARLKKKRIG
jgi:hypothetical protein